MATSKKSAPEFAAMLSTQIESVCYALGLGEPTSRSAEQVRYRAKGSLVLWVSGPSQGRFSDFEADQHGDALDLVSHVIGGDIRYAMNWADQFVGNAPNTPFMAPRLAEKANGDTMSTKERDARQRRALGVWAASLPIQRTPAETYLMRRCSSLPNHDLHHVLRFHPAVRSDGRDWPAMIAIMTDPVTNEPRGVHRTFLTGHGHKAEPGKKMLGSKGLIRLWPDEDVTDGLFISEGIETALAAAHLYDFAPIWACADAGGLAQFPVLNGIEELTILTDHDASQAGERAALQVGQRWANAGRAASSFMTRTQGDFADLIQGGSDASP